jgi:hypothetical protein
MVSTGGAKSQITVLRYGMQATAPGACAARQVLVAVCWPSPAAMLCLTCRHVPSCISRA